MSFYLSSCTMQKMKTKEVHVLGCQMDLGANRRGIGLGPVVVRYTGLTEKLEALGFKVIDKGDIIPLTLECTNPKMRHLAAIKEANARLYHSAKESLEKDAFVVTLGGDHSISSASITAVQSHFGNIGVIWVDAHGDFNNEETSPSGNIHGMSLSSICGGGPDEIIEFAKNYKPVNPANIVLIGGRDFDPKEIIRLKSADVTVFSISDIDKYGIGEIINRAIKIASDGTDGIHLSFDMDVVSPADAPGVSTPVHSGLTTREAFLLAEMMAESKKLISLDMVEINTIFDANNKTAELASELILSMLGKKVF